MTNEPRALPLAGVKVLDFSRVLAGPWCAMVLADFGAEVIKLEPDKGDPLRHWREDGVPAYWKVYGRNKKSIRLDLRSEKGKALLARLIPTAHVLVESFRPIAAIAILPLAILWFGTGTSASVLIVAYAAFFPIVVNTVAGVKRVSFDEAMNRLVKLMKADRDANFQATNAEGKTVNRWLTTGMLCASASSNESGYITHKAMRSMGLLAFDNQARV